MRGSRVLLFAAPVLLVSAVLVVAQDKVEPGFTSLFNGKNFDGWREASNKKDAPAGKALDGMADAFGGRFKAAEGAIVIDPAVKGDRYIETAKEFAKDVHIKLEFKAGAKCNNDLFLRGGKFDIVPGNKECKNVKEGEWCTLEIVVVDGKMEHRINGEVARTSKAAEKATPFKMRAEFGAIEIKNIRVKE
jgi:hypothetical protein